MVDSLTESLEENGYNCLYDEETEEYYKALYLFKKSSSNHGWISFYKPLIEKEYDKITEGLGSNNLSGVMIIQLKQNQSTYAISHGQAHFLVRKHCNKDFGLDLAERIANPEGLKLKHSQTFSSLAKKDITSYSKNRNLESSYEYAEAFNYVKCKTDDKTIWGETVDFGESTCFTFGKKVSYKPDELEKLAFKIDDALSKEANVHLPRYHIVKDKSLIEKLDTELDKHFSDSISNLTTDDYWLTGVSFNFSSEYKYSVKFGRDELIPISDSLNIDRLKTVLEENAEKINGDFKRVKIIVFNEDEQQVTPRSLRKTVQATIELDNRYYVYNNGDWIEFSTSYVKYIEEEVDKIEKDFKKCYGLDENKLIEKLAEEENYIQLHKQLTSFNGYCVEQADLMDDENIIMVKDQHQTSDVVYLIKQATSSLRLSRETDIMPNSFDGKNVCLWIILNRKTMPDSLSKLKSFHILDALNDFKTEVQKMNLNPVVWLSIKSDDF